MSCAIALRRLRHAWIVVFCALATSSPAASLNLASGSGGYYIVSAGNYPPEDIKENPYLAGVVDATARAIYPFKGYPSRLKSDESTLPLTGSPQSCPVGFMVRRGVFGELDVYRWRPQIFSFEKVGHLPRVSGLVRTITVSDCRLLVAEELFRPGTGNILGGWRWTLYSRDGARRLWSTDVSVLDGIVYPLGPTERMGGKVLHGNYLLDLQSGRAEKLVKDVPPGTSKMWVWNTNYGRIALALAAGERGRLVQSADGVHWKEIVVPRELANYLSEILLSSPELFFDPADNDHTEIWTTPYVSLPPGVTGHVPFVVFRTRNGGSTWDRFIVERNEFLEPPVPGPGGTKLQFSTRQASDGSVLLRIWRPGRPFEEIWAISRYKRDRSAHSGLVF